MAEAATQLPSALLQYLPAIYQEHPLLGQFLPAFEKILLGRQDGVDFSEPDEVSFPAKGLEETIAGIATLFDPLRTPRDFLPWLAGWTALSLRADLDEIKQRDFIANIIQLYRRRGTKENLQEFLSIFTIGTPIVKELDFPEFQIGKAATIGVDTYLGGGPPHFFEVEVNLPRVTPEVLSRQLEIIHALIELEKPAHTYYELKVIHPTMQIAKYSTVGVDTILGTAV
jgi:phage tail-like protein